MIVQKVVQFGQSLNKVTGQQLLHVSDCQSAVLGGPVALLLVIEGGKVIDDAPAQGKGVHIRIFSQGVEPALVVLAVSRFRFRRGDIIPGAAGQGEVELDAVHQAGVKINEIKFSAVCHHVVVVERIDDLRKRHALAASAGIVLVTAEAARGASAVIPEDQVIVFRGILLSAEVDECLQDLGVRHPFIVILFFIVKPIVAVLVDLIISRIDLCFLCLVSIPEDSVPVDQNQLSALGRVRRVEAPGLPDLIVFGVDLLRRGPGGRII